jgi:gamma-tubulin complex component 2
MVHFMDIAGKELQKSVKMIKLNRLESLLELSLRITSANTDPYKDDLKVKLFPMDLKSMIMKIQNIESHTESKMDTQSGELFLNGLSSFSLDYVIKWPLSLIINRKVS